MAAKQNTRDTQTVWFQSFHTILTNQAFKGSVTPIEVVGSDDLREAFDYIGEDLEMALVFPFEVIAVADMTQGMLSLHIADETEIGSDTNFWELKIEHCFAQKLRVPAKAFPRKFPNNLVVGKTEVLAVHLGPMQAFFNVLGSAKPISSLSNRTWGPNANFLTTTEIVKAFNEHPKAASSPLEMSLPEMGENMATLKISGAHEMEFYILESWKKNKGLISLRDDSGAAHLLPETVLQDAKTIFK